MAVTVDPRVGSTAGVTASPSAAPLVGNAPGAPAPGGARVLRFSGVGLTYADGTPALADIDLELERGELVSIVGPSGCGKSTLLRVAAGLLEASSGTVEAERERLGYVFQDATLLPWRTVAGNVELLAELHGYPKQQRQELARAAIELVGLTGFERHHPRRLSGGMRMRTSLARSLTLDPVLFLFDEPFGALDEITRERLNDELIRLFLARRFAGLFVTHSIQEAVFLSTRVVVMSARPGRIVAEIPVELSYPREPELRYSAQFASVAREVSSALRSDEP